VLYEALFDAFAGPNGSVWIGKLLKLSEQSRYGEIWFHTARQFGV
jgi:hypothetical protein